MLLFFTVSGSQPSGKSNVSRKRAVRCRRKTATGPVLKKIKSQTAHRRRGILTTQLRNNLGP